MAGLISGVHSSDPGLEYELHAAQTGGSGNNRTIKLTLKLRVAGSSGWWYAFPMSHKFYVNGTWSGSYTTKGHESWNGGQAFRSYEYNVTTNVGTTSSKAISVGFQIDSVDSNWDTTKTSNFTVTATNTAPYFDNGDFITMYENNSSGAVITNTADGPENSKKIGENVSAVYLSWPTAHDRDGDSLTYEVWYQTNDGSWSKIKDTTMNTFTHSIGAGNEGRSYDYSIKVRDSKGAVSAADCSGTQFQKNSFTTDTLASSSGISFSAAPIVFTYSGAKNTTGNTSFTRTLSCDGITVYNPTSFGTTAGKITLTIYKSGTVPKTCYVKFDDIKSKFKSASYKGTLNFTLTTRNIYGTSKTSTKPIAVNLQVAPTMVSSAAIAEDANSTAYVTVKTGTGATSTKYFIPNHSRKIRVNWGAGIGQLGEAVVYDVYVAYGSGAWGLIASNLKVGYYDHVVAPQLTSQQIKYKVRTKCVYNPTLYSDRDTPAELLHYYNGVDISVGTITRESSSVSVVVTVKTNTSIPNVNTKGYAKLYVKGSSTTVGATDTLTVSQAAQTVSISGLTDAGTYDLKVTYNDYTGLSVDKTHTIAIGQLLPVFDINKYGIGVNGEKADANYHINTNGAARIKNHGIDKPLLLFDTERPWQFEQGGSEGTSSLDLRTFSDEKYFRVLSNNKQRGVSIRVSNSSSTKLMVDGNDVYHRGDRPRLQDIDRYLSVDNAISWGVSGDIAKIFASQNSQGSTSLVLKTGDDGDSDNVIIQNSHSTQGNKNVLVVKRDFIDMYATPTVNGTAIVSSGSNANGYYVRLYDGTQICWREYSTTTLSITSKYGDLYQGANIWTFPASFASSSVSGHASVQWGTAAPWANVMDTSGTQMEWRAFDCYYRAAGTTSLVYLQAIGRWK